MLGNFIYHTPTKLIFGKNALDGLKSELENYGKNVMLVYGGGSIKKNGIYDKVIKILAEANKTVCEDGGVMPNPTADKVREGVKIGRENNVDFILAVGGGSVCDYAKAVAASIHLDKDFYKPYFVDFEKITCPVVPLGCVLTMVGTGSEMNSGSVITDTQSKIKRGSNFEAPKFSILNPEFTYSLPKYQMVAGVYDIMCHILEQYLSGEDDNTSDYIAEGLMRSLIVSSRAACKNPRDYEARSNIMWTATWALNSLIAKGKTTDWEVHMLGHAISAHTDATHGMTLAAVSLPYYKIILPYGEKRFKRFAVNVWGVEKGNKDDRQIALEGLAEMEKWMKDLGLVLHSAELGVTKENIPAIAKSTFIKKGGYKVLTKEEVLQILTESL